MKFLLLVAVLVGSVTAQKQKGKGKGKDKGAPAPAPASACADDDACLVDLWGAGYTCDYYAPDYCDGDDEYANQAKGCCPSTCGLCPEEEPAPTPDTPRPSPATAEPTAPPATAEPTAPPASEDYDASEKAQCQPEDINPFYKLLQNSKCIVPECTPDYYFKCTAYPSCASCEDFEQICEQIEHCGDPVSDCPSVTGFMWEQICPECPTGCGQGEQEGGGTHVCKKVASCGSFIVDDRWCGSKPEASCKCEATETCPLECGGDIVPDDVGVIKEHGQTKSGWDIVNMTYSWDLDTDKFEMTVTCNGPCGQADSTPGDDYEAKFQSTGDFSGTESMAVLFTEGSLQPGTYDRVPKKVTVGLPIVYAADEDEEQRLMGADREFYAYKTSGSADSKWIPNRLHQDFKEDEQIAAVGTTPDWKDADSDPKFHFSLDSFSTFFSDDECKMGAMVYAGSQQDGGIGEDKAFCDIKKCIKKRVCPVCDTQCGLSERSLGKPLYKTVCDYEGDCASEDESNDDSDCSCDATACCGVWEPVCPEDHEAACGMPAATLAPVAWKCMVDGKSVSGDLCPPEKPTAGDACSREATESCACETVSTDTTCYFQEVFAAGDRDCDTCHVAPHEWRVREEPNCPTECGLVDQTVSGIDLFECIDKQNNTVSNSLCFKDFPEMDGSEYCEDTEECVPAPEDAIPEVYQAITTDTNKPIWNFNGAEEFSHTLYDLKDSLYILHNHQMHSAECVEAAACPTDVTLFEGCGETNLTKVIGAVRGYQGPVCYYDNHQDVGIPVNYAQHSTGMEIFYAEVELTDDDTFRVEIFCDGHCGDADGDGKDGGESEKEPLSDMEKDAGEDFKEFASTEALTITLDIDDDGLYDFIVGIPSSGEATDKCFLSKYRRDDDHIDGAISSRFMGEKPNDRNIDAMTRADFDTSVECVFGSTVTISVHSFSGLGEGPVPVEDKERCGTAEADTGAANDSCCTEEDPCLVNEGDCDDDSQCAGSLVCGTDNCGDLFEEGDDCCMPADDTASSDCTAGAANLIEGNDECCSAEAPCSENEGDCDSDDQCAEGLICGVDNCLWGDEDDCCRLPYPDGDFDVDPSRSVRLHIFQGSQNDAGIGEDHLSIVYRKAECEWQEQEGETDCGHEEKRMRHVCTLKGHGADELDYRMPEQCCGELPEPSEATDECEECNWLVSQCGGVSCQCRGADGEYADAVDAMCKLDKPTDITTCEYQWRTEEPPCSACIDESMSSRQKDVWCEETSSGKVVEEEECAGLTKPSTEPKEECSGEDKCCAEKCEGRGTSP